MEVLREALRRAEAGEPVALATVIRVSGSTPRHPGAKMLVGLGGRLAGTVGGGRIEQAAERAAVEVAAGAPARRIRHHLGHDLAMCCGGAMEVWVEPVAAGRAALAAAIAEQDARRPCLLVTPLDGGGTSVERVPGAGGPPPAPRLDERCFVEPVWPLPRLFLFGAGHVGRAVGPVAATVGFTVVLCDDDETGALAEPPPWAAHVVDSFDVRDVDRALGPLGAGDFVVVATREHAIDERLVGDLLPRERLSYLGLIGSEGKVGRFRRRLEERGLVTPERWARLHAPLGLDIAAETPAEIAVALVAELIAVRNRPAHVADAVE
jgi:xanthine dehydrogenase accessory factor